MTGTEKSSATVVAFGELVLRLHSRDQMRFLQSAGYDAYYGGAEANVCVLLSRLGIRADYVSRIPDNDIALAGVQQLKSHSVGTEHILFGGDILGLYFTEAGNLLRPSRVIYDRAASSYAALQRGMINWKQVLKNAGIFHWSGVSAAVSQGAADVCGEALETAAALGLTISADFNYRSTLWQYGKPAGAVMPGLLKNSRIVVADLDSADVYFGIKTDPAAPVEDRFKVCCQALKEKMPQVESLAMSFRRTSGLTHFYSGAFMHKGEYYFTDGFELPFITDQIGSGDAFTAGIIYGITQNDTPERIISFAVACGALKQSIAGDWAIMSRAEIELFMKGGASGRLIR